MEEPSMEELMGEPSMEELSMEEPSLEEPSMQTTGTDTQGSSWTRPPERRLEDKPNESLIGEGSATWRRSLIWM